MNQLVEEFIEVSIEDTERLNKYQFVSCFFDLSSREGTNRRSLSEYLKRGEDVLKYCSRLIVYTEENLVETISRLRKSVYQKDDPFFRVVPFKFENLPDYHLRNEISKCREKGSSNPLKDTVNFLLIQWAKVHFMYICPKDKDITHIIWIDFGISHVAKEPEKLLQLKLEDRIRIMCIRPTYHHELQPDFFRHFQGRTGGGLWGVPVNLFPRFYHMFNRLKSEMLMNGLAPLEDDIVTALRVTSPELFDLYYGDYEDIIRNSNKEIHSHFGILRIILEAARRINDKKFLIFFTDQIKYNESISRINLTDDQRNYIKELI